MISPSNAKVTRLTKEGYDRFSSELSFLRENKRAELRKQLKDIFDDAYEEEDALLSNTRLEISMVDARIKSLEDLLSNAILIDPKSNGQVGIGSLIEIRDSEGETRVFTVVDSMEADSRKGFVSELSPLGLALLGRKLGDEIEVSSPSGNWTATIISIS